MSLKNKVLKKIQKIESYPYLTKNSAELEYFLEYTGSNGYLVIVNQGEFCFFTDGRYYEAWKKKLPDNTVLLKGGEKPCEQIYSWVEPLEIEKIYINPSLFNYKEVLNLRKIFEGIQVKKDEKSVNRIRMYKSEEEIQKVRDAVALTEEGLAYILPTLKEGMSEREAALELEYYLRLKGASELSFPVIVLFGENSAYPHGEPGDRQLRRGDVVLIDVGVKLGHYCSDMTRTFVFGNASHEFREVYNYLLKLQEETLETVRAGINASLLDRQLRKGLRLKDLEKYYAHSLGHGVGVEVHEEPAISHLRKKEKLERGMLFTIEPGVYIPEKFGIRIEDMVFIDKRGRVEILTQFPKELLEVR